MLAIIYNGQMSIESGTITHISSASNPEWFFVRVIRLSSQTLALDF